jgi:hypothetical protein
MTTGLVILLGVLAFLRYQANLGPQAPAPPPSMIVTGLAVVVAAACLVASWLVPRLVTKNARRQIAQGKWPPQTRDSGRQNGPPLEPTGDAIKLISVFTTQLILAAALTEGPAILAALAYMMEGSEWALGLALALIVAVALRFPTRVKIERWLDDQLELIDQERRGGR